jgi:hypothetical protein
VKKTRVARFALGFNPRRDAPPRGGFRELFPNTDDFGTEEFGTKSARVCVSGTTRERDERSRVVDEENEVLFINPVLGPELVAGSSRLKGGSATKIILDAAFAVAATVSEGRGTGHERGGSSSYDATATTFGTRRNSTRRGLCPRSRRRREKRTRRCRGTARALRRARAPPPPSRRAETSAW